MTGTAFGLVRLLLVAACLLTPALALAQQDAAPAGRRR